MATTFPLIIVTPDGELYNQPVVALRAPGQQGYFGVLAHHAPLLAAISRGVITITTENGKTYFSVVGGVVEVTPAGVSVLADSAQPAASFAEAEKAAHEGAVTSTK
jgi:F-type H+-transporting ATPase subunit epsilon